jgi:hypothetical protein
MQWSLLRIRNVPERKQRESLTQTVTALYTRCRGSFFCNGVGRKQVGAAHGAL